jgi:hypothetical protein
MKACLLGVLAFAAAARAQQAQNDLDESLVDRWVDGIDFEGCFGDLARSDRNGDGFVKQDEYLSFVQEYGKRICFATDRLTLQQSATFNTLACICRSQEGASFDCCIGSNAQIPTSGALNPQRTRSEASYLTSVCKLTDATIDGKCPPKIRARAEPPGALTKQVGSGGGNDGWKWALIAAAIVLAILLCCCCCVWRRYIKKKQEEEEAARREAEGMGAKGVPPVGIGPGTRGGIGEQDPEQPLPRDGSAANGGIGEDDVNAMGPPVIARGAALDDESEETEEGRKRRGGGPLPPDDEENGLNIPTAPRLPPPEDPPKDPTNLRPIPDKEAEDDEWDHPGRDINYPKDKDEMSAGEVDHYEPDGGVYLPEREGKDPLNWKKDWNRQKPEEPDEIDDRKHRIQSGLGEGEVWDKLEQDSSHHSKQVPQGDVFDWVVQSALGVLDKNDEAAHLEDEDEIC